MSCNKENKVHLWSALTTIFLLLLTTKIASGSQNSQPNEREKRATNDESVFVTSFASTGDLSPSHGTNAKLLSPAITGRTQRNSPKPSVLSSASISDKVPAVAPAVSEQTVPSVNQPKVEYASDELPPRRQHSRYNQYFPRPPSRNDDYSLDSEDCNDNYDDNYAPNISFDMFSRPMSTFSSFFNDMMSRIPSASSFENSQPGLSASTSGDGVGFAESIVSSNGRVSGIRSETRNGRTKITRFGDRYDEEDDGSRQ